jgi:hypothetical protein
VVILGIILVYGFLFFKVKVSVATTVRLEDKLRTGSVLDDISYAKILPPLLCREQHLFGLGQIKLSGSQKSTNNIPLAFSHQRAHRQAQI